MYQKMRYETLQGILEQDANEYVLATTTYELVKNIGGTGINGSKNTFYTPLDRNTGITHHDNGLGSLKINDRGNQYQVPVIDINRPMKDWRIKKW